MPKNVTGVSGEKYAWDLLSKNGYKLIKKNFRCSLGEIDVIAIKDDTLVFVEVKTRRSTKFGLPQEAVNYWKLKKIEKVGDYFVKLNKNMPKKRRIDVVSLIVKNNLVLSSKIIMAI